MATNGDFGKYQDYANRVLNGEIIAGKFIKMACQRYLSWFDRDDIEFRPEAVDRVVNFISKLKHFSGKSAGQRFILEPWQLWIVCNIFGWYYKESGLRVTNKAYIVVARKNGKTAFASALCLYGLLCDGESGAQVLNIANSREQGKLLFDIEVNFAKSIDPKQKILSYYRDRIKYKTTNSYARCLSSDSGGLDGLSASFFVCDETHEYRDSKLWDVLMSSQGFRQNPLAIQISTAGFNVFGFCHKYRDMCINILHGLSVDDGQFSAIYELDDEDRWDDEEKWVKANPNLDVTVSRKFLREQIRMAKNNSSLEVGVRTKNLNQWLSSSDIWLSNDLLLQSTKKVNLDDYEGLTSYVGVDLAAVSDLTAVALMIPIDGKYIFKTKYYLPSSTLDDNSNSELYRQWKRMGYLTITDGNVTDYDYIVNDLKKANEKVIIGKVAYDSWNATQWAITATAEGLPLEPFSQSLGNFNRPTKEFERLLKSGNIIIDDNEITRYCFSNVIMKYDYNENAKPSKGENQNKIDGVIAMIEALGIYLTEPQYSNEIMAF